MARGEPTHSGAGIASAMVRLDDLRERLPERIIVLLAPEGGLELR